MQHKVENLLTGEIMEFETSDLIDYVQNLWKFDEGTFATPYPQTLVEAFDYLNTYCDNLLLL